MLTRMSGVGPGSARPACPPSASTHTRYRTSPRAGTSRTTCSMTSGANAFTETDACSASSSAASHASERYSGTGPGYDRSFRPAVPNPRSLLVMTQTGRQEATFPASLVPVATHVEARIAGLLDGELARWSAVDVALIEPIEELRSFIDAGGKRLRPAFCHCAYVGAGGDPADPVAADAAAALELVHTFALVHDDVMDGSDVRRGNDAVHRHFVRRHATVQWRGEARRFGEGMAILVGDFAIVYADMLIRHAPS